MSTTTIDTTEAPTTEEISEDEKDVKTHIINPPQNTHIWRPGMTSVEVVSFAKERGLPIQTLCGEIFIPKRDTNKYPACTVCVDIAGELMRSMGE